MDQQSLSIIGHLDRCTVRIETDGSGVGTGFFFAVGPNGTLPEPGKPTAYFVVTNVHVIAGAKSVRMVVLVKNQSGVEESVTLEETLASLNATVHPEGVDLACLNLGPVMAKMQQKGLSLACTWIDPSVVPSHERLADIEPMSDIVMIGYPSGIWDQVHNKPVFRRGITATHPAIPWNGNPEFLIDTATFGGSSGSPVFAYSVGGYKEGNNWVIGGTRLLLIGVTKAVMIHTTDGTIRMVDIPTQKTPVPSIGLPNNLGVCVAVSELMKLLMHAIRPTPLTGWAGRIG